MSVYQIQGHWHYRFTINGTRYRKAIKEARTRRQAERAEQVARNEVFERRWGESGQRNFADFVEKVYKPHAKAHKRGFDVERSVLRALVDKFGVLRLAEITPEKVEGFQLQRANEKTNRNRLRSKATVNRDVAVLSAIFKLAIRLGEVKENPVSKIKWYNNLPKRDRVLAKQEEIELLEGTRKLDPDLSDKIEIFIYTGMRRSEMFRLEWRDIDFELSVIYIRAEITKTLNFRKIQMISNIRAIFEKLAAKAGPVDPSRIIFDGIENRAGAFSRQFADICERLNIKNVTAHSLRHTYSTWMNKYRVDPFAQQQAMGHARLSQTSDYTHQSDETFRQNFKGFEEHLRERNEEMANRRGKGESSNNLSVNLFARAKANKGK